MCFGGQRQANPRSRRFAPLIGLRSFSPLKRSSEGQRRKSNFPPCLSRIRSYVLNVTGKGQKICIAEFVEHTERSSIVDAALWTYARTAIARRQKRLAATFSISDIGATRMIYPNQSRKNFIATTRLAVARLRNTSSRLLHGSIELEKWRHRHTFEFTNYIKRLTQCHSFF